MDLTNSLLKDLVTEYQSLRPQIYFKSSMVALARALGDLVLGSTQPFLVIANFQHEKYFRQQQQRFQRMANKSEQVYVLGVPEAESNFALGNLGYETIPINPTDILARERYLVVIGQQYSACLAVKEKFPLVGSRNKVSLVQQEQVYEGIWTFERDIVYSAADWLLGRINNYRPELREKTQQARRMFRLHRNRKNKSVLATPAIDLGNFTQRLVTYLQGGLYQLSKAYETISAAKRKESLINKIATAQRSSLNPEEVLNTTVKELGQLFPNCRCLLYRLNPDDEEVKLKYEFVPTSMVSLVGKQWSIADNPVLIGAQTQESTLAINNVTNSFYLKDNPTLKDKVVLAGIRSWLMVSIRYQGKLMGMLELHYGGKDNFKWKSEDCSLIEAVSTTAGAALTQASDYTNLLELNAQLEAVERIQSNLIAIVGHELRTPLSTIRICLESLATEPDMSSEIKDSMLEIALGDTERLGQLVQNFLTLSKLESGKVDHNSRNIEPVPIDYPLNLALNNLEKTSQVKKRPKIRLELLEELPFVLADVDGLVEVFTKLLNNACKFTPEEGEIIVKAEVQNIGAIDNLFQSRQMLEIVIADTGRGIDENELEIIFERFSQSEKYLRRTVGGAGLGLIICRKIIQGMGGQIWATSSGEDQGSQFHFTLPIGSKSETNFL